jgi:NAD-dependent deacetylase
LHGIITRSQSSKNPQLTYPIKGSEIKMGDKCELGTQLRAHVIWFGEAVPMMEPAINLCRQADIFIIIGTSLAVYPAAGLVHYVAEDVPVYIIDPKVPDVGLPKRFTKIEERASIGVAQLVNDLLAQ